VFSWVTPVASPVAPDGVKGDIVRVSDGDKTI
jgi:hypothetical protein